MKIGLVRRGYSSTGGAEAYLGRFARAAQTKGHECVLFATDQWPAQAWMDGAPIVRVAGDSPRAFADALEHAKPHSHCDFLLSLERVWQCDAYRAGDGVHAAWLQRRAQYEPFWKSWLRGFNRKHAALLALEQSLFGQQRAGLVIANSQMVKAEISQHFSFPAERIHVVYNGVPEMAPAADARAAVRRELGFGEEDYLLLFGGSGWERKGLRFAISAITAVRGGNPTLLVAGRGNPRSMPGSARVRFLGPRSDMPRLLAAADAFILPTLYEPFSNACLEALAAGLPVLTTRFNGFAEVIAAGSEGEILDDPADTAALARAIESWQPRQKRDPVRERLTALGKEFSIARNVEETLAIIENPASPERTRL